MSKRMTPTAMKLFEYEAIWPAGNPKEPWWKKEGCETFFGLPTTKQFLDSYTEKARRAGKEEIRKHLREALGN